MPDKIYTNENLALPHQLMLTQITLGSKVLEMGCATGMLTKLLKEDLKCNVTAVEISEIQAEQAKPFADKLILGNIEEASLWEQIDGQFDYVIFGDVLEHLANPWQALERTKAVLKPSGYVLSSMPNIAFIQIRLQLLFGKFQYTNFGILDDTHLRFFTMKSMRELYESVGYTVESISPSGRQALMPLIKVWPTVFATQFVVKARCWVLGVG